MHPDDGSHPNAHVAAAVWLNPLVAQSIRLSPLHWKVPGWQMACAQLATVVPFAPAAAMQVPTPLETHDSEVQAVPSVLHC